MGKYSERCYGKRIYISQQDEAEAGVVGKCRSIVLREEKGEYGNLNLELKALDVKTDFSTMLQTAGRG